MATNIKDKILSQITILEDYILSVEKSDPTFISRLDDTIDLLYQVYEIIPNFQFPNVKKEAKNGD